MVRVEKLNLSGLEKNKIIHFDTSTSIVRCSMDGNIYLHLGLHLWFSCIVNIPYMEHMGIVRCSMDLPTNNPNPGRWPPRLEQLPPGWRHHIHLFDLTEGWKIPLKSTSTHNSIVTYLETILKGNEKVFQPSRTSGAKMLVSGRVHCLEGNLQ